MNKPTHTTYKTLNSAYDYFNRVLFNGELPRCLITLQRKQGSYGYYAFERFGSRDASEATDEIALNPAHFASRDALYTLSTLAHEMAHLWQFHFGKPSRSGYHNKEWALKMKEIGLEPFNVKDPAKETGQSCSHNVMTDGRYAAAFAKFAATASYEALYVERWTEAKKEKAKAANKRKYTCGGCATNVWGKPGLNIQCTDCEVNFDEE